MSQKIVSPIQVRFKDIDALGHVNNANHLSYLENARIEYFKQVIGSNINWAEQGLILARVEIDYKMPIKLTDDVYVQTWCSRTGGKSFDLDYRIFKKDLGFEVELASAKTVIVCFNYKLKKTIEIPVDWKDKLSK